MVAASFAETAGPAPAGGDDLPRPPPARVRQGRRAHRGGVGDGDRVPDPHRPDVRRRAAGVHPAVRRAGRLDAGRDDQPPRRRDRDGVDGARARSTWSSRRRASSATTSPWTARARRASCRGRVTGPDGEPIPGASVDVWQANDDGFYDVQQPGVQPEGNLRGLFTADGDGRFHFRSVVPRHYPIPDDGPVGELLAATGRHPYRPAHLHFIVSAPGYRPVTTHVFVAGSPYLDSDAVFGVKESLVREVVDGVLHLRRRPAPRRAVTRAFVHRAQAARVRFGVGALEQLAEEVDAVGLSPRARDLRPVPPGGSAGAWRTSWATGSSRCCPRPACTSRSRSPAAPARWPRRSTPTAAWPSAAGRPSGSARPSRSSAPCRWSRCPRRTPARR